ncbi:MAG: hypothetical protein ACLFS4_00340 [Opitutales bacterium]
MITRKIGKLIRGKTTPFQVYAACLLGTSIGFMPGFTQAPGLLILLLGLLLVLNANLFLAGIFLLLGLLFAELLLPVSFYIGQVLIDGPLHGLFVQLVNAPVFAWFGFDHYTAVGGLVLAILIGFGGGFAITRSLRALRRKLGALENDSVAYRKWTSNPVVKCILWLVIGGSKGKAPLSELAELRKGPHFRILGIILVVLAGIFFFLVSLFFSDAILTPLTRSALERANGATVNLNAVELRLGESRGTLRNLAMADPEQLDENRFAAETIELDLSNSDLLRRKFAFDNVEISGGRIGEARRVPGKRTSPPPDKIEKAPAPEEEEGAEEHTIEDYIKQAELWKDRLTRARSILERWKRGGKDPAEERDATWRNRSRERAAESGYATIKATHLIRKAPGMRIDRLHAGKVQVDHTPDETWDVTARNLSSQPYLLDEAPEIRIQSDSGKADFELALGGVSALREDNSIRLVLSDIPVETLRARLSAAEHLPFRGGSFDIKTDGAFTSENLDLPLTTTFHDTTLQLGGSEGQAVEKFSLPLQLVGPLDQPRIRITEDAWMDALRDAGKKRLLQEGKQLLNEKTGDSKEGKAIRGLLEKF